MTSHLQTVFRAFDKAGPAFRCALGSAILARVLSDIWMDRFSVHSGELYPYRHIVSLPLYGPLLLIVEWTMMASAGILFLAGRYTRLAGLTLMIASVASMTQMFQHQKMLFLIVGFTLSISPFDREDSVGRRYLMIQILIVYLFSALTKLTTPEGFASSLASSFEQSFQAANWRSGLLFINAILTNFDDLTITISTATLEILIACTLVFLPTIGFLMACAFHLALALFFADVLPFSLLMIALASLFLPRENELDAFLSAR